MSRVLIFTDGAAKGNPGPGGWGAIVADENEVRELGGHENHTTNNRMELRAAWEALLYVRRYPDAAITVHTDSSYVVNGATMWGAAWIQRGWMTKQKEPVLNRDMWEPFLALVEDFGARLQWQNVGGHIGVAGNERADEIADSFALGTPINLYTGSRSLYTIDLADLSHDRAKKEARSAMRGRSKQAAYSYVSAVEGFVAVHKTWKECEERVRGKKARFKKALTAAEEADIIQRFSK